MKDKYYTPDISEFHIGFEYERWCNTVWNKYKYEPFDQDKISTIQYKIHDKHIRVKYLGKEDIESLGFKYIMTSYDGYYKKGDSTLGIAYDGTIQITVRKDGMLEKEASGINIKNKSELKRLLKQLGIDGD